MLKLATVPSEQPVYISVSAGIAKKYMIIGLRTGKHVLWEIGDSVH